MIIHWQRKYLQIPEKGLILRIYKNSPNAIIRKQNGQMIWTDSSKKKEVQRQISTRKGVQHN